MAALGEFVGGLTPASAAVQHGRLFSWLCDRLGRRAWVERSGSSLMYMSQLAGAFSDAKFVHLYRDGRECAYSFSRLPAARGAGGGNRAILVRHDHARP